MLPQAQADIISGLCPAVQRWLNARFSALTAPQRLAIPSIRAGRNTLVCAPTGSGKTLSAFISVLSDLFERLQDGTLEAGIACVYISPLKALGSDVKRNLEWPLGEIAADLAGSAGANSDELPIKVAQRTGDTSIAERAKIARRPPHILITTPESLALCLTNDAMREHLRSVRHILIDELHSVASHKRGVDLMLSVERLSALVSDAGRPDPVRIGLSATIAPLERMADFLVGPTRHCHIADATFDRPLEMEIRSPFTKTPFATTNTINRNTYDILEKIVREHRTTLIFCNVRSATERVTYTLRKRFKEEADKIEAHHSSLDRELRLSIEDRLKRGELRCVVCSTSLELGIDIGSIDRVVLLNSPKGISRGLQRVGRSGHSHGATARGTFVPLLPGDLLECLVTARMMKRRQLDAIEVPTNCLDVLAQHLIAMAIQAGRDGIDVRTAYDVVTRTYPYATLSVDDFLQCLAFVATQECRDTARLGAKLWVDRSNSPVAPDGADLPLHALHGKLRTTRPGIRGLYAQNVGTITADGTVRVKLHEGALVGSVEEAFASMLKPGDRFILSGRCVSFVRSEGMTAYVNPSDGQMPTVPRWMSGTMSMPDGLASEMRAFRAKVRAIAPAGAEAIARMLGRQFAADAQTAAVAADYLHAQFRYGDIPTEESLLIERVPDDGATALVFHTMIGRAANDAIARLIAFRLHGTFGTNAVVVVDDYACAIWLPPQARAGRIDRGLLRALLSPEGFQGDLQTAVEHSEMFKSQFRFTALRSHAIVQRRFGRFSFIGSLQGHSNRLLKALTEFHPDHLLLRETRRTIMNDLLNAPAAEAFLRRQETLPLRILDLATPTPFAFGLFVNSKRDTMQLADTSDFLLAMYEEVQRRIAVDRPALAPVGLF
jgi:ATP-dependent Lhr-like helicase